MASPVSDAAATSATKRKKKGPAPAIAAALDAAASGGSVPHCLFFGSPAGCKQGQSCSFVHAGGPVSGAVLLAQFNGGSSSGTQAAQNGASTPYQNGHGGAHLPQNGSSSVGGKSSRRARSQSQDSIEEGEVSAPAPPQAVAAAAPAYSPAIDAAPSAFLPVAPRSGREKKEKKKAKTHKSTAGPIDTNDPFGIGAGAVAVPGAPAAPPAANNSIAAAAAAAAPPAAAPTSRKRARPDAAAAATAALAGFQGLLSSLPVSPFPLAALPGTGSVQQANGSATKRSKRAAAPAAVAPQPPAQQLLAALPIAPFVDPSAAAAAAAAAAAPQRRKSPVAPAPTPAAASSSSSSEEDEEEGEVAAPAASAAARPATAPSAAPGLPQPHANEWRPLLERTRAHGKYASTFSFAADGSWVTSRPCGPHCDGLPQVLAIDCEMCLSEDPVSKKRNHKELLRLSVVDGRSGATLLDSLVRPTFPVVDFRSWIHGVTAEHLASVAFTARHAQAAMAALCCQCTVLVGHALHNDLEALRFSHDTCVDTAMLFSIQDEPGSTPALRDVVKACLKRDIQTGAHDSVADAVAALDVAKHAMENGTDTPVSRSGGPKHAKGAHGGGANDGTAISSMLLVHRLPPGMTPQHIADVFMKVAFVGPTSVSEVDMGTGRRHTGGGATTATGKATVTFRSKRHAELAFETLTGEPAPDKSGRLQKRIVMQNKDYIQVRKMLAEPATTDALAK